MMNIVEQKAINGLIAFWSDSCSIRGKPVNREIRRTIKAKAGSQSWKVISSMPGEVKFFVAYADMPLQARRKWLDAIYYKIIAEFALYDPALRLFFLALWHTTEGVKQVELREIFTQLVGAELSESMLARINGEAGTDEILRFNASAVGLQPGSIAGANVRLKGVLQERLAKTGGNKS